MNESFRDKLNEMKFHFAKLSFEQIFGINVT